MEPKQLNRISRNTTSVIILDHIQEAEKRKLVIAKSKQMIALIIPVREGNGINLFCKQIPKKYQRLN